MDNWFLAGAELRKEPASNYNMEGIRVQDWAFPNRIASAGTDQWTLVTPPRMTQAEVALWNRSRENNIRGSAAAGHH